VRSLLGRATGAVNLNLKEAKRIGHGFRSFANNRLRLLLHAGSLADSSDRKPARPDRFQVGIKQPGHRRLD
jgi:hypothetical protein